MQLDAVHAQRPSAPIWVKVAAVPPAIALVVAGIWVAGGVITDDFRTSMALTAVWFAVVAGVAILLWRRVPALRAAAVAGVAAFVVVGAYLGYTSSVDRTVDETVVTGAASLEGTFRGLAHETTGTARVVEVGPGRTLTLTGFRTDPGPDLFVHLVPGPTSGSDVDGGVELAALKGNVGDQQYAIPAELDLSGGGTVVIWCRAFSVSFGAADLAPPGT